MKQKIFGVVLLVFLFQAGDLWAERNDWWQLSYRPRVRDIAGFQEIWRPAPEPRRYRIQMAARYVVKENPAHENIRIWFPLPADDVYQDVYVYRLRPAPDAVLTSRYGYRIAVYDFGHRPVGGEVTIFYDTEAVIGRVDWDIRPEEVGGLAEIPEQIRRDYVVNGPLYRIDQPAIVQAARAAVGEETNPLLMMARIALFVRRHLHFAGDGIKWDAPQVLAEGSGSCTEYSFLMIALARSVGLPARYMAGSTDKMKRGESQFTDRIFHKIVEVYLPRVGWVPVESSRSLRRANTGPLYRVVGWTGMRQLFFVHEPEPELAPLDPRRNSVTYVPFGETSRLRVGRFENLRWTRLD